jgi:uncharacterized protein YcfJ
MKRVMFIIVLLGLIGCTTTQKGAGIGAIAGGALGGIIGHQSGHDGAGAAIGAVAGGLGGALVGEQMDTQFCPKCGKHFTSDVKYCLEDGSELLPIPK